MNITTWSALDITEKFVKLSNRSVWKSTIKRDYAKKNFREIKSF